MNKAYQAGAGKAPTAKGSLNNGKPFAKAKGKSAADPGYPKIPPHGVKSAKSRLVKALVKSKK